MPTHLSGRGGHSGNFRHSARNTKHRRAYVTGLLIALFVFVSIIVLIWLGIKYDWSKYEREKNKEGAVHPIPFK